jgi:hypothetical protein
MSTTDEESLLEVPKPTHLTKTMRNPSKDNGKRTYQRHVPSNQSAAGDRSWQHLHGSLGTASEDYKRWVAKDSTPDVVPQDWKHCRLLSHIILAMGVLLLIGPLWVLNMLSTERARLTAVSVLIFSFVGLLGVGTGARPFETLGAAAA